MSCKAQVYIVTVIMNCLFSLLFPDPESDSLIFTETCYKTQKESVKNNKLKSENSNE